MEERYETPQNKCIVHQWQAFRMDFWESRALSVFSIDAREETGTQSSLIGFRILLEALFLRNRNVRHELLKGILKLFFRFLYLFFFMSFDPIPGHGHPSRGYAIALIRHPTFCRTPLDERLARLKDLYQTTHNTQRDKTSIPPAAFEPALPASKRLQVHATERAHWDRLDFLYSYKFGCKFERSQAN